MKLHFLAAAVFALGLSGCMSVNANAFADTTYVGDRNIAILHEIPVVTVSLENQAGEKLATAAPVWQKTGRGYEATIKLPVSLFYGVNYLVLTSNGEIAKGGSIWGPAEIQYLRQHDVTAADPACLGGKAWCATRDL